MTTETLTIGGHALAYDGAGVTTTLPGGLTLRAEPQTDAGYIERAEALGHGSDTLAMCQSHETAHAILAHLLGLPESPTLRGVAVGSYWPHWREEESAALGLAAFANAAGVSLIDVARRMAGRSCR